MANSRVKISVAFLTALVLTLSPLSSLKFEVPTVKAVGEIEIDDCEELQLIGNDIAYPLDEDYILTQDIDCSLTDPDTIGFDVGGTWGDQTGFNPIGTDVDPFTGTFNGQGFTIDALFIDRPLTDIVGLFGWINSGEVINLGLTDINITGNNNVGGIAGFISSINSALIDQSYSIGFVAGTRYVGGLVGASGSGGGITNSYSDIQVTGSDDVGGLVGENRPNGLIDTSYSLGVVDGVAGLGGLVGNNDGTVTNSYWNTETSEIEDSEGGTGKTTLEMKDIRTYVDENTVGLTNAWDFNGNISGDGNDNDIWELNEAINNGYPYLVNGSILQEVEISTCDELSSIGKEVGFSINGDYTLTQDIDCSLTNPLTEGFDDQGIWGDGTGFNPIGSTLNPFTGSFNGQDFTISNIYINKPDTDRVGLFGYLVAAQVSATNLIDSSITGNNLVGSLVGFNHGTVFDSSSQSDLGCSLSGVNYIGGLIGYNTGSISTSYSDCVVDSTGSHSGVLTGMNDGSGQISNSYSKGTVNGNNRVGGLAGTNAEFAVIQNSFSATSVAGDGSLGGLLAFNIGTVTNSYWDTQASGLEDSAAGTGKTTSDMKKLATYSDWDFEDVWGLNADENSGYPFLRFQGFEHNPPRVNSGGGGGGGGGGGAPTTPKATTLTYEQEVALVLSKGIVTQNPTADSNKCEVLVMMSRVFDWQVTNGTTSFTDVPDWCANYASYASVNGIIKGRTATTLGLDTPVSRYEVAVMLYRELQRQNKQFKGTQKVNFSDQIVEWASQAVTTLAKESIVKGFADGSFGGQKGILKQDLGIMLLRTQA